FMADGLTQDGPAVLTRNVTAASIQMPRSVNWDVEVDREWLRNLFVRARYQQRDTRFDPVIDATTTDAGRSAFLLRGDGQSRYRAAELTTRYEFHGGDQIVTSYTRSEAIGNLNQFNSYFGNIENPVIRADETGRLPWDAPNRFVLWSHLTLPEGFTFFPLF